MWNSSALVFAYYKLDKIYNFRVSNANIFKIDVIDNQIYF